jgi:HK97 gp10 family phage protein
VPNAELSIKGLPELRTGLKSISDTAPKQLRKANLDAAKAVISVAAAHAPVRTGKLRASVKALATQTAARMKAGGTTAVPYAPAVHWGTGPREGQKGPHNIKPNPFLWNARNQLAKQLKDDYERELEDVINSTVRDRPRSYG